jgi:plasmid stability protein
MLVRTVLPEAMGDLGAVATTPHLPQPQHHRSAEQKHRQLLQMARPQKARPPPEAEVADEDGEADSQRVSRVPMFRSAPLAATSPRRNRHQVDREGVLG